MTIAECERCKQLCTTHFSPILGALTESAFRKCLESIQSAGKLENLQRVVVDIDESYYQQAKKVHSELVRDVINGR